MNLKWEYVEPLNKKNISKIENYFNVDLPEDYKKALKNCNRGKPNKDKFDIDSRKECVLDYMIDLENTIKTAKAIEEYEIIPIAKDPFGNLIGYQLGEDNEIKQIVFWDHENMSITPISKTFDDFLKMLY